MRLERILLVSLVFLSGILYWLTIAPDAYLEDSGELASASYLLGIAHPSGYPFYLLIGKLFTFLPFGSIAFRLNLMSAVFAVATAVVLFLALVELGKIFGRNRTEMKVLAFVFSLSFAVSRDFWSQSIVAEVYTLNTFFAALCCFLFFKWWTSPKKKYLYWLALSSGLGLANHLLLFFLLIPLWAIIFLRDPELFGRKFIFKSAILFFLGCAVYLYIPIRAYSDPVINFGHLSGWFDSLNHILRTSYGDMVPGIGGRGFYLWSFFSWLVFNLNFLVASFAGIAVIRFPRENIELYIFLLLGFISSWIFPVLLRDVPASLVGDYIHRVYYFQSYVFILFLAFLFTVRVAKIAQWLFTLALVGALVFMIPRNYLAVDLNNNQVSQYYQMKLESFSANAVYLLVGEGFSYESEAFVLFYLQKVRKIRQDIQIIDASKFFSQIEPEKSNKDIQTLGDVRKVFFEYIIGQFGDVNLYTSFPVEAYSDDFISEPTGFAVKVLPKGAHVSAPPDFNSLRGSESSLLAREKWDFAYQDFLADAEYLRALRFFAHKSPELGRKSLAKAFLQDNEVGGEDYRAVRAYAASLLTNQSK